MKLLVYGMQSSGASTFTYFLGQRPSTITIVDLWQFYTAPALDCPEDAVLKCVVLPSIPLERHCSVFQPDRTILFLRDPLRTYLSLREKFYADDVPAKFRLLEEHFRGRSHFDACMLYEEFLADREGTLSCLARLGWNLGPEHYELPRSRQDIIEFNCSRWPWAKIHFKQGWGFGRCAAEHGLAEPPAPVAELQTAALQEVRAWCPSLCELYAGRRKQV